METSYNCADGTGRIHETLIVRTSKQIDQIKKKVVTLRVVQLTILFIKDRHDSIDAIVVLGDGTEHVSRVAADA